jgi:L-lactate permease
MLTIILFALLSLLPIAALAIALTVFHWKAWAEAQFRAFDSSLDHVTEE